MKAVQIIGIGALLVAGLAIAVAFAAPGAKHLRKRRMKTR